jgi:Anti-sigma-28 factor, FlgM
MRVNPNTETPVVAGTPSSPAAPKPRLGQDKLALSSDTISPALEQTPEVRADKVAEAKALLQNGSYPPAVIIRKISALLAIHVNSQDTSY